MNKLFTKEPHTKIILFTLDDTLFLLKRRSNPSPTKQLIEKRFHLMRGEYRVSISFCHMYIDGILQPLKPKPSSEELFFMYNLNVPTSMP